MWSRACNILKKESKENKNNKNNKNNKKTAN